MIYFDNAATTLQKPKEVAQAVFDSINSNMYGNPSRSSHDYSLNSLRVLTKTRIELAKLFGIEDEMRVVFTSNVTTSLNLAIKGFLKNAKHVISSDIEHNSVLRPLYQLEKERCEISFVPIAKNGHLELKYLENLIRKDTKALVLNHASNVLGSITDLDFIYDFCINHNLFLILDGAQSAGTLDVKFNKRKYPNMVYTFTGHKSLYGPQGSGGMIILGDIMPEEVFTGGSGINSFDKHQPSLLPDIFEYGTINVHSISGLLEGVRYINKIGIENIEKDLYQMTKYLYKSLEEMSRVILYNELKEKSAPIVSMNLKGISSQELSQILWEKYKIASRGGFHCAPRLHKSMDTENIGMVRFSLSTFNTFEEIDFLLNVIELTTKDGLL
ncbi:MAG: aminotransferase class V-fold PLP-dependent enzyme [Peptoniphilaceae bacterium]